METEPATIPARRSSPAVRPYTAEELYATMRDFAADAPDEINLSATFWTIPAVDAFPQHLHGRPVVIVGGVYIGPTDEGERILRDLSWQFEAADAVMPIPRIPVYVESADVAYLDLGIEHFEPCGRPNTPRYRFAKGFEWEVPVRPDNVPVRIMPGNICFELKWLDGDEFGNWTGNDFVTSERASRKQRDWRLFTALNNGEQPDELERVERGSAPHVIEKIRATRRAEYETMTSSVWARVGLSDRF